MDCVLSRDPYCGWDTVAKKCVFLSDSQRKLIQSVKDGDAFLCPDADPVKPMNRSIWPGGSLYLPCPPPSNLAQTTWERDAQSLTPSTRLQLLRDKLSIVNTTDSDAGLYRCQSVEFSKGVKYTSTVAEYQVSMATRPGGGTVIIPEARTAGPSATGLQAVVGLLLVGLVALLAWNFYKGHLPLPWNCGKKNSEQSQRPLSRGL